MDLTAAACSVRPLLVNGPVVAKRRNLLFTVCTPRDNWLDMCCRFVCAARRGSVTFFHSRCSHATPDASAQSVLNPGQRECVYLISHNQDRHTISRQSLTPSLDRNKFRIAQLDKPILRQVSGAGRQNRAEHERSVSNDPHRRRQ